MAHVMAPGELIGEQRVFVAKAARAITEEGTLTALVHRYSGLTTALMYLMAHAMPLSVRSVLLLVNLQSDAKHYIAELYGLPYALTVCTLKNAQEKMRGAPIWDVILLDNVAVGGNDGRENLRRVFAHRSQKTAVIRGIAGDCPPHCGHKEENHWTWVLVPDIYMEF